MNLLQELRVILMDEMIKCGDFTLNDFLKEKSSVPQNIIYQRQFEFITQNNMLEGSSRFIRDAVIQPLLCSKYRQIDLKFLDFYQDYDFNDFKIRLPRFAVISLQSYSSFFIVIELNNSTLDRRLCFSFSTNESVIMASFKSVLTGIDPDDFPYWLKYDSYSAATSARDVFREMKKSNILTGLKDAYFKITTNDNFLIPDNALNDIKESRKYFPESHNLIILDCKDRFDINAQIDKAPMRQLTNSGIKEHTNALIVTNYDSCYYLISAFNPLYTDNKSSIDNNSKNPEVK